MKYEEFLSDLLRHTKRRVKLMELGAGVVTFFAALVALVTAAVVLDHTVTLPRLARWAVLVALDGAVVVALVLAAGFLLRRLSDLYAARLIERNYPQFRNTLISYLEARNLPDVPAGIKAFIEEQATEKAVNVNPDVVVSPRRLVVGAYALLAAILVFFFYALLSPKSVTVALRRIWEPAAHIAPATATRIVEVEPGSTAALIGSDLPVRVDLRGVLPERVVLRWSREQELWEGLQLEPTNGGRRWQTTLADLEYDLYYYIEAGDARSRVFRLLVVPTPLVTAIQTHYRFPAYSGLAERVTYRGDVETLEGTVITVRAHTNTTLARARLLLNDRPLPAAVLRPQPGQEPGDTVEASFTVSRTGYYSIRLEDPYGFTNPDPPRYEVLSRYDQPPTIRILEPQRDVRIPLAEPLRIRFEAADDLGLASLEFHYKVPGESQVRALPLPLPARTRELTSEVTVRLDRLGIQPGQSLATYLQATDTFPQTPHVARSDTLVVLVPLPEELTEAYAQAPPTAPSESASPQEGPQPQEQPPTEAVPGEPGPQPAEGDRQDEPSEPTLEQLIARDWPVIQTIRRHLEGESRDQAPAEQVPPGPQGPPADEAQAGPSREPAQAQAPSGEAGQPRGQAVGEVPAGAAPREDRATAAAAAPGEPGSGEGQSAAEPGSREGQAGAELGSGGEEPGAGHGERAAAAGTGPGERAEGEADGGEADGGEPSTSSAAAAGGSQQASASEGQAPAEQAAAGQRGSGSEPGEGSAQVGSEAGEAGGQGQSAGESAQAGEGAEGRGEGSQSASGQAGEGAEGRGEGSQSAPGSAEQGAAGQAGPAGSSQAQGSGARSDAAGARSGDAEGTPMSPAPGVRPGGGEGGPGGGGGGGTTGQEAPELQVPSEWASPPASEPDLRVVGPVIDELFDRLLRNDISPELLQDLNWDIQDLAVWVVTYKAKLDQLPQERPDAGVLLGGPLPGGAEPEERVIEMATPTRPVTSTLGDAAAEISPDELRELFQGAKGTVSPEYRQLMEDYYKALSEAAGQ